METPVIGSFVSLQRGTTYKSKLLGMPGPVLLGLASIARNGGFRSDNLKTYGGESAEKLLLYPGDIYVSLKDVTQSAHLLGAVSRVPPDIKVGRLTQDTVALCFTSPDAPKDYIYWVLRTPQYREYCRGRAMGTTNLSLSREDFLSFPVPELTPEKKGLVSLLQALDDSIDLNRKMNGTLEAMARTIFKSWFVDFDPVRARAEGRKPEGMDAETAKLFPNAFEDSGERSIPKGWRVAAISECIELTGGGTPKTSVGEYWNGGIPWFSVVDAPSPSDVFVVETEKTITTTGLENSSARLLREGTTIISARGTVGKLALLGCPMAMNQSCYGINGQGEYSDYFVYYLIREMVRDLQRSAHGSVFDTITQKTFETVAAVIPPPKVACGFDARIGEIMARILANLHESSTLRNLRDVLLPKLLSGDIRIDNLERFLEEIA